MLYGLKIDLERTKTQLEFYRLRVSEEPTKINKKWLEIYSTRADLLEKQIKKIATAEQRKVCRELPARKTTKSSSKTRH